jgi:hypothetical protein
VVDTPHYAAPAVTAGAIGAQGGALVLDGDPYRFVGLNAYELGTEWGTDAGCGAELLPAQLDAFFGSLPPHSLVRFWAFEGTMAVNATTHQIDWTALDNVFAAAAAHQQLLIPALTAQGGDCDDDHWQDPSWYEGGFTQVYANPTAPDATPLAPLSYWGYLQAIVQRYRNSPALGMWEPISEPEASTCPTEYQPGECGGHQICPDEAVAAQAMRHFFDVVGEEIHHLDPRHLVESGTLGGGQCGTEGSDYAYVSASPGLDVLSYHDYYGAGPLLGGDQWNGIGVRIDQAAALGKPIIGGEMGYTAPGGTQVCPTAEERAVVLEQKAQSQMAAGSSGVLFWDWVPPEPSKNCDYDIVPGDPLMAAVGPVSCRAGPESQPGDVCRLNNSQNLA